MTLTNRLSASFLGALALVLVGFSTALYSMASIYLHRSVAERLAATLATLSAMAEDEPGGFDWEHDPNRTAPGHDSALDQVRWIVFDPNGLEIDRSRNLANADRIESPGLRKLDRRKIPWRVVELRLTSSHPADPEMKDAGRYPAVVLRAGLRLDSIDSTLWSLAVTLTALSVTLWGLTALLGRWICRRALAPLTRMAATARELGVDDSSQRLALPATADEVEDLALAFNGLIDRMHEALERQARFAGDASHQLRTPLTALIGQIEVALRRDRAAADYRQTLSRVGDQAERLRRIIESLLFLARADAEAVVPSFEEFDLVAWVKEKVRDRMETSPDDRIVIRVPDEPIYVRSHPALLGEVLSNLLANASDHAHSGSPVEVRMLSEPGGVSLSVADQGSGIAERDLDQIFEPFYRASPTRGKAPAGVGLGLSIARRITEALGGRLEVQSEVGQGSRFIIRIASSRPSIQPSLTYERSLELP